MGRRREGEGFGNVHTHADMHTHCVPTIMYCIPTLREISVKREQTKCS